MSNNNYFYDIYENKTLKDKKSDYKNEEVDVRFILITYYITISKIRDLLIYRKY